MPAGSSTSIIPVPSRFDRRSASSRHRFHLSAVAIAACALMAGPAEAQPAPSATSSAAAPAADLDSSLARAQSLMQAKDAAGAFALLSPLEAQHAGEPRFDYLFGIAAIDSGHVTRAIFALERVVAEQPSNALAHAELARAYLAAGESAAARRELELARLGNMPVEAAAAIDRVLGALAEPTFTGSPSIRGYVEIAGGHDSNLNSATANGQFALPAFGGIVFALDPASQRRGAAFMALGAGADVQVPLTDRWSLTATANGRRSFNDGEHDLNQRQVDGSAGASYSVGPNTWSAALQTSTFWLDSSRYRSADGMSAQWQHALGKTAQLNAFGQWSKLKYPGQDTRNADRSVLGIGYAQALGIGQASQSEATSAPIVYGSLYGATEDVKTSGFDNYGHHAVGLRAGGEYTVGAATWFTALQYESRRYGGPEPFFDTTRHDRQSDLAIGVRYVPRPQWRITPQITHTRSASNVTLYDYRRTVFQIILRRDFN
ncbi:hypothetical protein BH09PSE5_BH09PSE5_02120 [soil metagenome]